MRETHSEFCSLQESPEVEGAGSSVQHEGGANLSCFSVANHDGCPRLLEDLSEPNDALGWQQVCSLRIQARQVSRTLALRFSAAMRPCFSLLLMSLQDIMYRRTAVTMITRGDMKAPIRSAVATLSTTAAAGRVTPARSVPPDISSSVPATQPPIPSVLPCRLRCWTVATTTSLEFETVFSFVAVVY